MKGWSEANQASQTQVTLVFNDIKAAVTSVSSVRGSAGQLPNPADLRVGGKKV